jgi:hypothetical protein
MLATQLAMFLYVLEVYINSSALYFDAPKVLNEYVSALNCESTFL